MKKLRMKPHSNGLLITFCGLDGCGKSTMIRMLKDKLEACGKPVMLTKQPTSAVRNSEIFRNYMDVEDHSGYEYRALSLLAASDRIQHANQVILPELNRGGIVISDRYIYSCLANLRARGYRDDRWIYEIVKDIPKPDLAFFLDVPVDTAVWRVRCRPEEAERFIDMELQYRLREEYRGICARNGGILLSTEETQEETFAKVWNETENCLKGEESNEK